MCHVKVHSWPDSSTWCELLKYCSEDGQNQIIQHTFRNVSYLEVRFCFSTITTLEEPEIRTYHIINGSAIAWIAVPLKEALCALTLTLTTKTRFQIHGTQIKGCILRF